MTGRTPVETRNLDNYGNAQIPWSRPHELLESGVFLGTTFLGTVRPDGSPHSAGIGAVWLDGDIYFSSGQAARKSRNLAANPACTISARLATIDLVFEGEAVRITDAATVERVGARFREGGWPVEVEAAEIVGPYNAPSAGPPPWHVYHFTFHRVVGNATAEPHGATLWRFER